MGTEEGEAGVVKTTTRLTSGQLPAKPKPLRGRNYTWVCVGLVFGLVFGTFIGSLIWGTFRVPVLLGTVMGAVIVAGIHWPLARARYFREARNVLVPHRGFVCLTCHYPLTGNPDEGVCPECGTAYRRDHTVWVWREYSGLGDELAGASAVRPTANQYTARDTP